MIVLRLRGRLGNQLFIYAFGRALQEKYGDELVFIDNVSDTGGTPLILYKIPDNIRIVSIEEGKKFEYYKMKAADYSKMRRNIIDSIIYEKNVLKECNRLNVPQMSVSQKLDYIRYKLICRNKTARKRFDFERNYAHKSCSNSGLFLCENGYIDFPHVSVKNKFGAGYFQSEKYFRTIKDKILKEIEPKNQLKEELREFIAGICTCTSVCLSIRMGDYLNNPILGVCSHKYYQDAINKIYELYSDALIYVFSDDIDAVMKAFSFKNKVIYEPQGNNEVEKLKYMSLCKHFIISNSSFSWWAQYLSKNYEKTVIAPSKWFVTDIPCDIYQDNWILLDT